MDSGLKLNGDYFLELSENGIVTQTLDIKNLIVNEGLGYVLSLIGGASPTNLYVVPTANAYTALGTDTLASILTSAGEVTAYSATSRPQWSGIATGTTIDNSVSLATFAFTGSGSVNGILICTQGTKGSSTGKAYSYVALSTAFGFTSTASLAVKYSTTASSI